MPYGVRFLGFLLSEESLRKCQLLGVGQSTDDETNEKFATWQAIPIPDRITSLSAWSRYFMPLDIDPASLEYTEEGTEEPSVPGATGGVS